MDETLEVHKMIAEKKIFTFIKWQTFIELITYLVIPLMDILQL